MHIENLKLMKTMLEEIQEGLPDEATFNLEVFIRSGDGVLGEDWRNPSCGFSACALGFAALDPRFRELGLRPNGFGSVYLRHLGLDGFDAADELFKIDQYTCAYLFEPEAYRFIYDSDLLDYTVANVGREGDILPSHVIARIDYLLSNEDG